MKMINRPGTCVQACTAKRCPSPKVKNGVENQFFHFLKTILLSILLLKYFELPYILNG